MQPQNEQQSRGGSGHSVNIGSVYGSVAVGGNANTTTIYNETIKAIDEAKGIDTEQKTQAKAVLDHAAKFAAPLLPAIAESIRKSLGL
jgi:hypothetical protein